MPEIVYKAVSVEDLNLNVNEVANRLGTARGYTNDVIEECKRELEKVITPKFSFTCTEAKYGENGFIDLGYMTVNSNKLTINLKQSPRVYTFAATTGLGVDRLLQKLSKISQARFFITDSLASAYAEALADYADKFIRNGKTCQPRFSPGFGDLGIEVQPMVLDAVNARKLLGITLSKSYLMTPMKSVTALIGERE
jgi:hypothetical protein